MSGRNIRLGSGAVSVRATRGAKVLTTVVRRTHRWWLTVGAVLPRGAAVAAVRLDGHAVRFHVLATARGHEVRVAAGRRAGTSRLVVRLR